MNTVGIGARSTRQVGQSRLRWLLVPRRGWPTGLRVVAFALFGLAIGVLGLSMAFSDLGPGETETSRNVASALFFLLPGWIIGFLNPRYWVVSVVPAWGGPFLATVAGFGPSPISAP